MRKRVFKRWRTLKIHPGKRPAEQDAAQSSGRGLSKTGKRIVTGRPAGALSLAACLCLLLGTARAVHGEEVSSRKEVVTNIEHRHLGSPDVCGGCFNVPIEHIHQGDPKNGGGCYVEPIPHVHVGSGDQKGGCYTEPVEHQHRGDETSGGDCYEPVYHEHSDDCEKNASCTYTLEEERELYTQEDHCFAHGTSTFVKSEGTAHHQDCGLGSVPAEFYYCRQCNFMKTMVHSYCDREGEITGYRISCGREGEIEGYRTACGFEADETEGYRPGCGRTVDGYGRDCGLKEGETVGRLILTAVPTKDGERVLISARVEDLSGGKIVLEEHPYVWRDREGNLLGTNGELDVQENGDYSVTVKLKNRDVDESGLHSSILVDSIGVFSGTGTPSPEPSQSPSPKKSPDPSPGTESSGKEDDGEESDGEENAGGDGGQEGSGGEETVKIPEKLPVDEKTEEEETERKEGETSDADRTGGAEPGGFQESSDLSEAEELSPEIQSLLEVETGSVRARENMAENTGQLQVKQTGKRRSFFSNPGVKMITLTAGALFLMAGLFLLLLYLRRSVKIYNDDGDGRMIYLGRRPVLQEEDVYSITITEAMVEKSCTNRYCIRPGLYRVGRSREQEMIVYKESKKAVITLNREMIVIL